MAQLNQDLSNYTTQDFNPVPPGKYDFEINDSEIKDTKTRKRMITVSCKIMGPTHVGRIVFENFVIGQEVAMVRLKTLATVGGHQRPDFIQDTQELHGLRFRGNVGIRENEGYSPQNNIKSFEKIPSAPGGAPQAPFQTTPTAQFAQPAMIPVGAPMAGNFPQPPSVLPQNPLPRMSPPPAMQPPLAPPPAAQTQSKPSAPWMK